MTFCKNCGTKLNPQDEFCPNCGTKNETPQQPQQPQQPDGMGADAVTAVPGGKKPFLGMNTKGLLIAAGCIVVTAVLVIVLLCSFFGSSSKSVVKDYYKAIENCDAKDLMATVPKDYLKELMDDNDLSRKELTNDVQDYLDKYYDEYDDIKVTFEDKEKLDKNVSILVPQRGDGKRLSELAVKNAREEAERATSAAERLNGTLALLQSMLRLPEPLHRMEAYDISNTAGTDIVASMTVFVDGKPKKSDYKRFKLENMEDQDDYASMRQVLCRRFCHYLDGDKGFDERPDVLLIDGGAVHAETVREALETMGIRLPIFGMVKDNRHRTRALVTPQGEEIGIQASPAVFALIGRIQEETHRFAITYHRQLRSKHVRGSTLDAIEGIGEKRQIGRASCRERV